MNAFDADCLIYAANDSHPSASRIQNVVSGSQPCVGSVMLLPELMVKPIRVGLNDERIRLTELLAELELIEVTRQIADLSVSLGAKYGLRSIDGVHLATAVVAGADRFITNNQRDFPKSITEIDVVYPAEL